MKSVFTFLAAGVSAVALASAAQAADAFMPAAPIVSDVVTTGNWDGPFIGVFGGGTLGSIDIPVTGIPFSINPEGWTLGVDAGFNFALGNGLVLGLVGDLAWADISDDLGVGGASGSFNSTIDWTGSVRARIGWDAGNYMPYLTAGLAAAHNTIEGTSVDLTDPLDPVTTTYSDDQTHVGWTIGAGVEFAVAESLSIDVGYRYTDYGTATYTTPGGLTGVGGDLGLTSHQLTVGLHYGF